MIASSAEVAGLVIAENLGTALPYVVAPVKAITYLITDARGGDERLAPYGPLGVSVISAHH
jgi:DeoR/GlpR family transcriptional regulator of sugar metabolism